jgi:hypothetical protein
MARISSSTSVVFVIAFFDLPAERFKLFGAEMTAV